jgi:hypothetical protein
MFGLNIDWLTALLLADRLRQVVKERLSMLKIILALVTHFMVLKADIEGVVNEVKDAPDGRAALVNGVQALRKLADDLEKALE